MWIFEVVGFRLVWFIIGSFILLCIVWWIISFQNDLLIISLAFQSQSQMQTHTIWLKTKLSVKETEKSNGFTKKS